MDIKLNVNNINKPQLLLKELCSHIFPLSLPQTEEVRAIFLMTDELGISTTRKHNYHLPAYVMF